MISKIWLFLIKACRDILTTVYDDFNFQFMSLPRGAFFLSIFCVVISWYAQQFLGFKFEYFPELIKWALGCMAAYGVKIFVKKGS